MLAQRRAAHLQTDRQLRPVNRQQRQIHAFEAALLDERGWQILPGDDDMGLRLRDISGHVRRREDEAVAEINAVAGPWLLRRAVDVDGERLEVGLIRLRPSQCRREREGDATEAEDFRREPSWFCVARRARDDAGS